MQSHKKLEDLEYNLLQHKRDKNISEGYIDNDNKGCLTLLAIVLVFIVTVVCIVGAMQVGKNRPSITCAEPGCSNHPKPGSNYCWIHGRSGSSGSSSSSSSGSSSGGGSILGGSSSDGNKKKDDNKTKIWGGKGNEKSSNSSSNNSSSGSSGGSSSGSSSSSSSGGNAAK